MKFLEAMHAQLFWIHASKFYAQMPSLYNRNNLYGGTVNKE